MTNNTRIHHTYSARITWTGNRGQGTQSYGGYGREYDVEIEGKPALAGSAHPSFRGLAERHDPEDLFLAAVASCHMLAYLALCSREGVRVTDYRDDAGGTLALEAGAGGRFSAIELRPAVTVAEAEMVERAGRLHETTHQRCFIAASCSVPIRVVPTILVG